MFASLRNCVNATVEIKHEYFALVTIITNKTKENVNGRTIVTSFNQQQQRKYHENHLKKEKIFACGDDKNKFTKNFKDCVRMGFHMQIHKICVTD